MFSNKPSREAEIILASDPRLADVPVHENGEPLVDLSAEPRLRFDAAGACVYQTSPSVSCVRAGAAERLVLAQTHLPQTAALLIIEGHRPLSVQQVLFDRYLEEVRRRHPTLSGPQLIRETSKFVAPPALAPHSTGGAVDLTLIDLQTGRELDMGTVLNADPEESRGATFTAAAGIGPAARKNREILAEAMQAAGFVNYPPEWWHWSYGDRYWAFVGGRAHAIYGSAEVG